MKYDVIVIGAGSAGCVVASRLAEDANRKGVSPGYEEATERFRELAGDRVRIEFGSRSEDRYGRILFYVYTYAGESV